MSVKKIFILLITVVACVIIGAFVLNVLLPNVTTALVDSVEDMIYNATGMNFDFNGNGSFGEDAGGADMINGADDTAATGAEVTGFELGQGSN